MDGYAGRMVYKPTVIYSLLYNYIIVYKTNMCLLTKMTIL